MVKRYWELIKKISDSENIQKKNFPIIAKPQQTSNFIFPFGWGELWGIAHRGDYDLSAHMRESGKDLSYSESESKLKYTPHVIEPSLGVDRLLLAILCNAYKVDEINGEERSFLSFHPRLAPVKASVLPLSKKLSPNTSEFTQDLRKFFNIDFDDGGSIGRRYRRQDEIGTPFCITFDFDSLEDQKVTIRDRDTTSQERISIDSVKNYLQNKIYS